MELRRRGFLSLGALALAGCLGGEAEGFDGHPATDGIGSAAVIGGDTEKRIVAFEDPSCPTCARFHSETFPRLADDARAGEVSIYTRAVPLVRQWSSTATPSLYATYERDTDAYWKLFEGYYANQGSITEDTVEDMTHDLLEETEVDADGVLDDVGGGVYSEAVETAVSSAEAAGIGATPTFYLFDADGFVTDASGARSYDSFATALDL